MTGKPQFINPLRDEWTGGAFVIGKQKWWAPEIGAN